MALLKGFSHSSTNSYRALMLVVVVVVVVAVVVVVVVVIVLLANRTQPYHDLRDP